MPEYIGESTHEHGSVSRVGILLANLGTPDGPDAASVRRFLAEFLWDPRVVESAALALVAGAPWCSSQGTAG